MIKDICVTYKEVLSIIILSPQIQGKKVSHFYYKNINLKASNI